MIAGGQFHDHQDIGAAQRPHNHPHVLLISGGGHERRAPAAGTGCSAHNFALVTPRVRTCTGHR